MKLTKKEKLELKLVKKIIREGDRALKDGKTRSFKDFIKAEFPQYLR